jgi:hypothetical protein
MKKPARPAKPARKQPKRATAPAAKQPQHPKRQQRKPPVSKAVHRARHQAAVKAAQTRAKHAKAAKLARRGLSPAQAAACCPAEALAASLRLSGWPVSDLDVLALHKHTAAVTDAGAFIPAVLDAACEYGLAGVRLASFAAVDLDDPAAVILGVALPAPHTVCAGGGSWWSWGERWSPDMWPDAVIEEAWAVNW